MENRQGVGTGPALSEAGRFIRNISCYSLYLRLRDGARASLPRSRRQRRPDRVTADAFPWAVSPDTRLHRNDAARKRFAHTLPSYQARAPPRTARASGRDSSVGAIAGQSGGGGSRGGFGYPRHSRCSLLERKGSSSGLARGRRIQGTARIYARNFLNRGEAYCVGMQNLRILAPSVVSSLRPARVILTDRGTSVSR